MDTEPRGSSWSGGGIHVVGNRFLFSKNDHCSKNRVKENSTDLRMRQLSYIGKCSEEAEG